MRKHLALVAAAVAFALVSTGANSCGTSSNNSGNNDTASPSQSPAPKAQKKKVHAKPQYYSGVGDKNLGTIVVPVDSTLSWSQPTKTNFVINNDFNDDNTIDVNAIGTHDTTQIAAGTYHKVEVIGQDWKMKIVPNQ
jgi:hypothetical protein